VAAPNSPVNLAFGGNEKQKTLPAERSGTAPAFSAPVIGADQGKIKTYKFNKRKMNGILCRSLMEFDGNHQILMAFRGQTTK
jgi:hypothetical protein